MFFPIYWDWDWDWDCTFGKVLVRVMDFPRGGKVGVRVGPQQL
jgi:hypothetical protein